MQRFGRVTAPPFFGMVAQEQSSVSDEATTYRESLATQRFRQLDADLEAEKRVPEQVALAGARNSGTPSSASSHPGALAVRQHCVAGD
jgi:hypothetical protein